MDVEKLDKTINELEKSSKQLKGFSDLFSELSSLHESVNQNNEYFKNASSKLDSVSDNINDSLNEFRDKIEEMDGALVSRLDRHKSDIGVDIRNEGTQIQRAFENSINNNFNNLSSKFDEKVMLIGGKINTIKTLTILSIAAGVVNFGLILYILFKIET